MSKQKRTIKLITVPVTPELHKEIHAKAKEGGLRVSSFAGLVLKAGMEQAKSGEIKIVAV